MGIQQVNIETGALTVRMLGFFVNGNKFFISLNAVREIVSLPKITNVFNCPSYIKGVINLRGEIVAVIDMGLFFGEKGIITNDDSRIIVIEDREISAGLLVGSVEGICMIDQSIIKKGPSDVLQSNGDCATGMAQYHNAPVLILDALSVLLKKDSLYG